MKKAKAYDLTKEEQKMVGKVCPGCGWKMSRVAFYDLRVNKPKKESYYLHCGCLHPGDGILGSAMF